MKETQQSLGYIWFGNDALLLSGERTCAVLTVYIYSFLLNSRPETYALIRAVLLARSRIDDVSQKCKDNIRAPVYWLWIVRSATPWASSQEEREAAR